MASGERGVPLVPHRDAGPGEFRLDVADPQLAEVEDAGGEHRVGSGAPRTLTGEPMELLLWLSGRRSVARVEVG